MGGEEGTTRLSGVMQTAYARPGQVTASNDVDAECDLQTMRLHEAIGAQAARTPEACAVMFEGVAYSFAWLEARSGCIASRLAAFGVRRGDVVAVHMHRSPLMVAALIGCLRAGAAYLPLDPAFPQARLRMVLDDAQPAAMIGESTLDGTLQPPAGVARLLADAGGDGLALDLNDIAMRGDDLAYVLYTSGSTGRPKGVEITHEAVMNLLASFSARPGFGASDRMLAATTTAFDISVIELFLPLVTGGTVVLASADVARDPERLAALISKADCTTAQATPSLWRFLLDAGWSGKADLTVLCGGEALTRDLADRLLDRSLAVWNVYGPTETTVWSTIWRVEAGEGAVPIGLPIADTSLHLVDAEGQETPPGAIGELLIGGAGLARGYRGRPDLTRERFVWRDGKRLYRTGDLARIRADGAFECLGRTDHQVKIRGFRIELGDVEAALAACPGVGACAVVASPVAGASQELVAYVSGAAGVAPPAGTTLRHALAVRLPDYMIPSRIVALPLLPLTPNGKIDRNALPSAPIETVEKSSGEMRTGTEHRLSAIWKSVLGLPSVSRDDNFFDLGGYSLLTLNLLREIQDAFGRRLSMASLFAVQDLAEMARMLDAPETADGPVAIRLQPDGDRPPLIWLDAGPQLRPLAARLAPDQPLLGLTVNSFDEALTGRPLTVRDLAQRMVVALRSVQPCGPYYIGGWCRWGSVAHAAAAWLRDEGEEVRLLVLLDTVNHASAFQTFSRLKGLARMPHRPRLADAKQGFGELVEAASLRYRPARYLGNVLLLRAADADRDWDGRSGWADSLRGTLQVADLPGDHRSVLAPPFVDALATILKAALVQAQRPCG